MNRNGKRTKTMSLKQIAANRSNALKSTGPKTADGKAASKMNAVKHGILSEEVVVRGMRIQESAHEFKKLREQYWEHLAPVGPVEEMLVERIVTTYWRLRRALTAETGEITLSVDNGHWSRKCHEPGFMLRAFAELGQLVPKLKESAVGISVLTMILEKARDDVKQHGELTEEALGQVLKSLAGKPNEITEKLTKLRAMLADNPDGLAPEALKAKHQEAVLKYIENELSWCRYLKRECEEREDKEEEARQAASVLPSSDVLDKILRYETTLERQLYRAMHQLERLQRMRQGEFVPAPVTMEVSQRC
jgi:hypothetical protein